MYWLIRISKPVLIRQLCLCAVLFLLPFWSGCQAGRDVTGSEQNEIIFTASGITVPGTFSIDEPPTVGINDGDKNLAVDTNVVAGSLSIDFDWEPGREYEIRIGEAPVRRLAAVAPQQPSLAILKMLPLGGEPLSFKLHRTESSPSAAAISPDGSWLAIGSNAGDVSLVSITSGEIKSKLSGFKSYIRSLAITPFSEETYLFVGEQSPKGTISAYRVESNGETEKVWSYECYREIGEGKVDADDPYSWAHQPGIYRILPGPEGALFALATHSEYREGKRLTSSCFYKFDGTSGKLLWKWPRNEAYDAVATWFSIDEAGRFAAVCSYLKSGVGEVVAIDCSTGGVLERTTFKPLRPHMQQVNFWKSVAMTPDGKTAAVLSDDGRAWIWDWVKDRLKEIVLGKPILVGDVPLLVSGAGIAARNSEIVFITGVTYLPWDLSKGQKPHQPHPAAQKLFGFDRDGKKKWELPLPNLVQGFAFDREGRWLFAGYSSDPEFAPGGGSGMMIIDMHRAQPKLIASYAVEGGLMHGTPVISKGGRTVVLIEKTQRDSRGDRTKGSNTVHILRW